MRPVALPPNLIDHFYAGGAKIAALRGIETTSTHQPEEWLAATVCRAGGDTVGLSRLPDGTFLRDAVAADPSAWTGPGSAAAGPADTGLLVKLLDAGQRLPVHVHPDRAFAARHLSCPYGKTEAWYVLDATGDGAVYLGWTDDVDPDELARRRDAQDSDWMLGHLNRVEVRPGDGVLVPAGTAHAIGEGVFVAEVQEPTDFSIVLEWAITTTGREDSHLGLGFDTVMPAVDHTRMSPERLAALRRHTAPAATGAGRPRRCPPRLTRSSASTCGRRDARRERAGAARLRRGGRAHRRRRAGRRRRQRAGRRGSGAGRAPRVRRLARRRRRTAAGLPPGAGARMTTAVVLGLDVGSTNVKALAATTAGDELHVASVATPWVSLPRGRTEMEAATLVEVVAGLLARCVREIEDEHGPVRVTGIGVSGMAEAGVLLDTAGRVAAPAMAWFDPRGADEIAATPADFRAEFPRRTGLPVTALASVAKLLHLRGNGVGLVGHTWLNVPELVVHALGGERVRELSLASRTGLLDQDDADVWPRALEVLGVGPTSCRLRYAPATCAATQARPPGWPGTPGSCPRRSPAPHSPSPGTTTSSPPSPRVRWRPASCTSRWARPRRWSGCSTPRLSGDARERLAGLGINVLPHVVRDRSIMLVGTRSGLLLRRVLQLVGVTDHAGAGRSSTARCWRCRSAVVRPPRRSRSPAPATTTACSASTPAATGCRRPCSSQPCSSTAPRCASTCWPR